MKTHDFLARQMTAKILGINKLKLFQFKFNLIFFSINFTLCETDPLSLSDFWYISDMTSSIFKAAGLPTLKLVAIRHTVPKIFWIFALQTSLENWWQYATLSQKYSEYSHYKQALKTGGSTTHCPKNILNIRITN